MNMMIRKICKPIVLLTAVSVFSSAVPAQKRPAKPAPPAAKPIIFAVVESGSVIEPIALIDRGKLEAPVNGSDDAGELAVFNRSYLRKGTSYRLVFGGAAGGTATIQSSDPASECAKNMAVVTTKATKTPIKGLVMALATNSPIKAASSYRRRPTAAEKTEADSLAKAEFAKHKLTPKVLRYHNLTALDLEKDGSPELVASYWVEIDKLTRGLLFFIAGKGSNGKYAVGHQEYRSVDQGSVMSGSIKDVDDGVYHELLLDVFDHDGDGTAEVFTYTQSFEGAGFNVYKRNGSKWIQSYEFSNYHCGY